MAVTYITREPNCPRCGGELYHMTTHMALQCSNGHRVDAMGFIFGEEEKSMMQPKDLLVHLEKGDRTMEMVKATDDGNNYTINMAESLAMLNRLGSQAIGSGMSANQQWQNSYVAMIGSGTAATPTGGIRW